MSTSIVNVNNDNVFLQCSICSFPLSAIPIYYNSTFGLVCGRCEGIKEDFSQELFERQIMFEIISRNLIFPCAFRSQGCLAELNGDVAFLHEQTCLFRVTTVSCPLFHEKFYEWCTWIGDYIELSDHIRNEHRKFFKDDLKFTLTRELGNKVLFSEMNEKIIIIIFEHIKENNSFRCWIMSDMYFKQCLENKYQISFSAGEDEPVVFEGDKLEYISQSVRTSPEYNLTIPITTINHLLEKYDEMNVSITIVPKETLKLNFIKTLDIGIPPKKPSDDAELTTRLLHELECPICTELMGPPIYTCSEGHNMCSRCRNKILECSVCRGDILGGRNFTLEKLCSVVAGPCVYRKDGCSYVGTVSKVKEHEPFCYLAIRSCVLDICEWYGRTLELPEHLDEEHTFRDISRCYTYKLCPKLEQHMFLYEDKIFLMNLCSMEKKTLNYSVYCLGGKQVQYDYEIELMDPTTESNKMVLRDACPPIGYNFNKNSILLLTVPVEMLLWLLRGGNELKYRVNIYDMCE